MPPVFEQFAQRLAHRRIGAVGEDHTPPRLVQFRRIDSGDRCEHGFAGSLVPELQFLEVLRVELFAPRQRRDLVRRQRRQQVISCRPIDPVKVQQFGAHLPSPPVQRTMFDP